ncbi:hypothetical protein TIFTF001_037385 [Ficus carica]|uniref:Uncharacterized protein n=1 Tax=Ficus carica TaxID=3494 RepID=A0AA88J8V7_FICCA|nr:hypothetical protein TIFTF001_037385 [Ficus carica]
MYSQIDGIYFSHTAILSGPASPESPAADATTDCDVMSNSENYRGGKAHVEAKLMSVTRAEKVGDSWEGRGGRGEDEKNDLGSGGYK